LDKNKDQSYFLAQISQKALANTLFPLGELEKPQVRAIADKLKLSVAKKKDSTGICFIGERDFKAFLANYLPAKSGPIIDLETKAVLGNHVGVLYYTLGQRKGLDINAHEGPWFVAGKDIERNELYVVKGEDNPWLFSHSALVNQLNWFNPIDLSSPLECTAKFRYRQKDQNVILTYSGKDAVLVTYKTPIAAVTPGQEAVFYLGEVCLGGGVIEEVYVDQVGLQERLKAKR
jgi:tRNA-specific 2-thiouridylase